MAMAAIRAADFRLYRPGEPGLEVGYVNYFAPGQKQWMEVLPGALRGIGHACAYETALQLALRPTELAERIATRITDLPPACRRPTWRGMHRM